MSDIRINKKRKFMNKIYLLLTLLLTSQLVIAGCGGCGPSRQSNTNKKLLESIPYNKFVSGNVLISCGMCNFMTDDNNCNLAIKIGRNVLPVNGKDIDAHGDSHSVDGYCNVIKKAYVEGRVKNNKFYADKIDIPSI